MMTKYPQVARRWLVGAVCVMGSQMTWAATAVVDFSELVEQNANSNKSLRHLSVFLVMILVLLRNNVSVNLSVRVLLFLKMVMS